MPYIITTKRPLIGDQTLNEAIENDDVTAVATLDEVRSAVHAAIDDPTDVAICSVDQDWRDVARAMDGNGTVGPLPDDTVIEVRPMLRTDVTATAGEGRYIAGMTASDMVAAFNAR